MTDDKKSEGPANHQEHLSNSQGHLPTSQEHSQNLQDEPPNFQKHLPNSQKQPQDSLDQHQNLQEKPQNLQELPTNPQIQTQNLQELPTNPQIQAQNLQNELQNPQEQPQNPPQSGRHSPTFTEITNQFYKERYQGTTYTEITNKHYKERYEGMITRIRLERSHYTTCPNCSEGIFTVPEYHVGVLCWVLCFVIAALGGIFGCCLLPFILDGTKDIVHRCPKCKRVVRELKRALRDSFGS